MAEKQKGRNWSRAILVVLCTYYMMQKTDSHKHVLGSCTDLDTRVF